MTSTSKLEEQRRAIEDAINGDDGVFESVINTIEYACECLNLDSRRFEWTIKFDLVDEDEYQQMVKDDEEQMGYEP